MNPLFITGIGTDVGKTVVAAIVTEALQAAYWKPIQAGYDNGTDSEWVAAHISRPEGRILPETYRLSLPASPHIAARQEGIRIDTDEIARQFTVFHSGSLRSHPPQSRSGQPRPAAFQPETRNQKPETGTDWLVIEGAGGLLVPLNESEFVLDLALKLQAPVLLVSRNYLGSINHSLLTAKACRAQGVPIAGWVFNDQYGGYEEEIVQWSGIPSIASIPYRENAPDKAFVLEQAARIRPALLTALTAR